ncbi:NAD(P)/FAD-dependent oxidoreductase [Saccharopolyspora sp. NPDC050389]|uniref:flavin-containing monooxygenase n=1 Tax=Saccharopolyspora sp. NPDC050389 TaxID=3155516 RepID=UPI0033FEA4FC
MRDALVIGGGQAGLAAARALRGQGCRPVVLEAGLEPVGSWPAYYDSLILFTPARFNELPGARFPGDPNRYPDRAEVIEYLRAYARDSDCEIRAGQRVVSVTRAGREYRAHTAAGEEFRAPLLVAATGAFGKAHRPELAGLADYTGAVLHSADYRRPEPFTGQRVVVVGAGNSAVQIAVELAAHAHVSLATRKPVQYATNEPVPGGSRFWSVLSAFARIPAGPLFRPGSIPVLDNGGYRTAIESGRPDCRELFAAAEGTELHWPGGAREHVDTVILATGYRPALDYLAPLGVLDAAGRPKHRYGIAGPGLGFVGLENQRTFLSATLHGVGRDARYVARKLSVRDA